MGFAVRIRLVTFAAIAMATLAAAAEPLRTSIPDLAGRPVSIDVTVGHLTIEGWAQPGLQVEIVPEGKNADAPAALEMGVDEGPDGVLVRAVQPAGGRDPERRARVHVRVPAGATIRQASVFEGRITLTGLTGPLQAAIQRGPIAARALSGIVRLETQSGDLTVEDAVLSPQGLLRLRTFNGAIVLKLATRPEHARILALTLNGAITSSLPLSERAGFGPRFREGVFGRGEPLISLDAVRGDITVTAPAAP